MNFAGVQIMQFCIIHILMHIFKCKVPFNEIYISRLNILSARDSTNIVRSSHLVINLYIVVLIYFSSEILHNNHAPDTASKK